VLRSVAGQTPCADHRFPGEFNPVDEDRHEVHIVETPLGEAGQGVARGTHKAAADTRLVHAESLAAQVDDALVVAARDAADHAIESRLRHRLGVLHLRVRFEFHLVPVRADRPHAGLLHRHLLAGHDDETALTAMPGSGPLSDPFVRRPAQPLHLIIQQVLSDARADLHSEAPQRVMHQPQQFLAALRQQPVAVVRSTFPPTLLSLLPLSLPSLTLRLLPDPDRFLRVRS
jgi:hypothetical protein